MKDVNVKLARFLVKNENAPLSVKLEVVNACINSALLYGCETWSNTNTNTVETLQRSAVKMVLNVSRNTPNEIVYLESGLQNLRPSIYKRQFKFFRKLKADCEQDPASPISRILNRAFQQNGKFIRHYTDLDRRFISPDLCYRHYSDLYNEEIKQIVNEKFIADNNSILGTYKTINPSLEVPIYNNSICCHECDRKIITKYRVGCHKLRIQSGRLEGEGRDLRLCTCGNDIQTISHVLFNCPLSISIRDNPAMNVNTLTEFFAQTDFIAIASVLKTIEKIYVE